MKPMMLSWGLLYFRSVWLRGPSAGISLIKFVEKAPLPGYFGAGGEAASQA